MDILHNHRVEAQDPELYAAIAGEERRQRENLELIASGELREPRGSRSDGAA